MPPPTPGRPEKEQPDESGGFGGGSVGDGGTDFGEGTRPPRPSDTAMEIDRRLLHAMDLLDRVADGSTQLAISIRRSRALASFLAILVLLLGLGSALALADLRARQHAADAEERAAQAGRQEAHKAAAEGRALLDRGLEETERRIREEVANQGRALRKELEPLLQAAPADGDAQFRRETLDTLVRMRSTYLRRLDELQAELATSRAEGQRKIDEAAERQLEALRKVAQLGAEAAREAARDAAREARDAAAQNLRVPLAETEARLRGEVGALERRLQELTDEVRRMGAERGAAAPGGGAGGGPAGGGSAGAGTAPGAAGGRDAGEATGPQAGAGRPEGAAGGAAGAGPTGTSEESLAATADSTEGRTWTFFGLFGRSVGDWAEHHLSGSLEYRGYGHFRPTEQDSRAIRNEGRLRLKYVADVAPWLSTVDKVSVRIDDDQLSRGVLDDFEDDASHRRVLDVEEAYFDVRLGVVDLTLGRKIFSWGTATLWNPTDRVNPLDYTDILETEKLGVFAADAKVRTGAFTFEGVYVPTFTPARFPLADSRWAVVPKDAPILVADRDTLEESQFAARVQASLGGVDVAATYYEGINPTPSFQVGAALVPIADPPFLAVVPLVTPRFNKFRMAGLDLATTFGRFEVHGEAAQTWQDDPFDYDSFFQFVVGSEVRIDGFEPNHDLRVTFEYAGEVTTDRADPASDRVEVFFNRPYQGTFFLRLRYDYSDDGQLQVATVYNADGPDNIFLQPSFSYKLTDTVKLETGVSFLFGPSDRNFGFYKRNDRAYAVLTYSF
ncbi:MAG: hypothetical protein HYZ53_10600 [Planctomycetes bacterium]|nr:hypothetical protein [Planctomycetota bacterium]